MLFSLNNILSGLFDLLYHSIFFLLMKIILSMFGSRKKKRKEKYYKKQKRMYTGKNLKLFLNKFLKNKSRKSLEKCISQQLNFYSLKTNHISFCHHFLFF